MTLGEAYERLAIKTDFIPVGVSNRPGTRIHPTHICIHETDNESAGADALAHARYMKGEDARRRKVSWHLTVDDERCVKHLPLSEKGFHAGTAEGNRSSIGIEICVNNDGNYAQASERAALLAAVLCQAYDFDTDKVVPHKHFSGKNCPSKRLALAGGFGTFRLLVDGYLEELE